MGRFTVLILILLVLSGVTLWFVIHLPLPQITIAKPSTLTATAYNAQPSPPAQGAASNAFDETGTIVLDHSDGPNGVPYILYTPYSESGKASIATKRLVFAGEFGCQASALPCATRPPSFPVAAGQQVRITGIVDAQNVYVEGMDILSEPAGSEGD